MNKKTYSTPKLTAIGSVRDLTLGTLHGNGLDHSFPAGTTLAQLRFS